MPKNSTTNFLHEAGVAQGKSFSIWTLGVTGAVASKISWWKIVQRGSKLGQNWPTKEKMAEYRLSTSGGPNPQFFTMGQHSGAFVKGIVTFV